MKKWHLVAFVVGCAWAFASGASAATLYFDFGDSAQLTGGNYNNITPTQDPILNAIDSTGASTGIGLESAGFNELGPNLNGTTTPTGPASIFDPQATRDNLFGHSDNFNAGSPRPMGQLLISGLDGSGATVYGFTFFASRTGVSDNRETQYAVSGANSGNGFLDASGNVSNVATVLGIRPTASGEITIEVTRGPNNNNGSEFYYLGAMQIVSQAIPEPNALVLLSGAVAFLATRRPTRR